MNASPPSTRQVVLGIFIVGQLLFLATSNWIGFAKDNRAEMGPTVRAAVEAMAPGWLDEKGHFWSLTEHAAATDKMWAQATGQFQTWSLFAPTVAREVVFPSVEYRWDDVPDSAPSVGRTLAPLAASQPLEAVLLCQASRGAVEIPPNPVLVRSENEPVDPSHYYRVGNFRLRRYENNLVITLVPHAGETDQEIAARWSENIRGHVAEYADILHGYLRWRLRQDSVRWPERRPPGQVIFVVRRYHISGLEEAPPRWTGPHALPIARWQPAVKWDDEHQPLEWYDPVAEQFTVLPK